MKLINADALCAYLNEWSRKLHAGVYHNDAIIMDVLTSVFEYIANMPTVDAEPVRHGRWIFDNGVDHCYKCSECKGAKPPHYIADNYCPNCGAKMDEEAKE